MHAQAGEQSLTLNIACPAACMTLTAPLLTSQHPARATSLCTAVGLAPCLMQMHAGALLPVWGQKVPRRDQSLHVFARHLHQDR